MDVVASSAVVTGRPCAKSRRECLLSTPLGAMAQITKRSHTIILVKKNSFRNLIRNDLGKKNKDLTVAAAQIINVSSCMRVCDNNVTERLLPDDGVMN